MPLSPKKRRNPRLIKPTPETPKSSWLAGIAFKPWTGTIIAILLLALLVWTIFYFLTPDFPLTAEETSLLVFFCALAVWLTQKLWHLLRQPQKKP